MTMYSESAERAVLGAAMAGSGAIPELLLRISSDALWADRHKVLWRYVQKVHVSGRRPDIVTVKDELEREKQLDRVGGEAYLMELADEHISDSGINSYAEVINSHYIRRLALEMARNTAEAAQGGASAEELVQMTVRCSASLTEAASPKGTNSGKPMSVLDQILNNDRPQRLMTGYHFLDGYCQFRPGNLIVIGATPGSGKTSLGLAIAFRSANTKNVLFNSLEMEVDELTENMMAFKTGIKLDRIMNRELSNPEMKECYDAIASRGDRIRIVKSVTVADLAAKARAMKQNGGLELIVVDYLQLMDGPGDGDVSRLSGISRGLKMLAAELQVPVIALSQLSREGAQNGRPLLRHLRGSGSIEQDANIVIFLWMDPDGTQDRMITIAKNRRGSLGETRAGFDGSIVRFYDIKT